MLPSFQMTCVATASLSSSGACAAMRCRASSLRHAAQLDEPPQLGLGVGRDDDDRLVPPADTCLDEQRHVEHHDPVERRQQLQAVRDGLDDRRVGQLVQHGALRRIPEHDPTQRRPVDEAHRRRGSPTEVIDDLAVRRLPREHDLAGDLIGVDELRTAVDEAAAPRCSCRTRCRR
jgi:hypothetical protein